MLRDKVAALHGAPYCAHIAMSLPTWNRFALLNVIMAFVRPPPTGEHSGAYQIRPAQCNNGLRQTPPTGGHSGADQIRPAQCNNEDGDGRGECCASRIGSASGTLTKSHRRGGGVFQLGIFVLL